ncbi:MAG: 16S rRNA processing protein RimM [Campylobacter sp.]|nr:16S rRNA processing protein RimM [Campylobacter sp.]
MLLEVAKIGKTVGLKGALKLHDKSDFPEQFKKNAKFYLKNSEILEILSFNPLNFQVIFKGYEDINLAQKLVNETLYQSCEETRKSCILGKDEFFHFDIIGLNIVEDGEILGVVKDIYEVGMNDLFEVKTNTSDSSLPEIFYIPYIDEYVLNISLEKGEIQTKNAKLILKNS